MVLWEQIAMAAMGLLVLFFLLPGIKASMARSKNSEEKHWGTIALLALILIAFVFLLISSV